MAEPPKAKRPSRSKKAPEPDFSPFEDWLIDGPAGKWPEPWEREKEFSEEQKRIVEESARLLLDREAWLKKVQAFDAALLALADETRQKQTRARYQIRFDRYVFPNGTKDFSNYPFPCSVLFPEVVFGDGDVLFIGARFGDGDVVFSDARFGDGSIAFDGSSFGEGAVSFFRVDFGDGDVSFSRAMFGDGNVSFVMTKFGDGDLLFSGTRFGNGNVLFYPISFRSTTMLASDMVVAGIFHVGSDFAKAVDFSRLDVRGAASFSNSSFHKVPDFRDAKFARPPEVAGMQVQRPQLKGWNREEFRAP